MNILPKVKEFESISGEVNITGINWVFCDGIDERLIKAANKISKSNEHGISAFINAGNSDSEAYRLVIGKDKIEISSEGAAGAFYALQSLGELLKNSDGKIKCCEINDSPDMKYRGFYHDVTRGKVPTLETLKKLVDTMVRYKMNSLQLYIEHTYEFKEYEFCLKEFGYLTKEEIRELDVYCTENFVELVPSLSTFGHLFQLLSNDKYKHLCELANYEPEDHYWIERMLHHTINPVKEESFELIKSLIDQHVEAFTSDKFNICCDETFDLGNGVEHDVDKGTLYLDFVNKIIGYLKSKGKKVMMWGDVVLEHPDRIGELPEDVIFLNWDYSPKPNPDRCKAFVGRRQIVCPGTNSWSALNEDIEIEEKNIGLLAQNGYKTGAFGLLNTNWGDHGNIASIEMAAYGLICGAAVSWNKDTMLDRAFRKEASLSYYGDEDLVDILAELSPIRTASSWRRQIYYHSDREGGNGDKNIRMYKADLKRRDYEKVIEKCKDIAEKVKNRAFYNEDVRHEMLLAICGAALFAKWNAGIIGEKIECFINFEQWKTEYKNAWMRKNKESELKEILRVFDCCEQRTNNI